MPSEAYLKAASAANREPVIHLAIESVSAIKQAVTLQADWSASKTIDATLTTNTEPGTVRMEHSAACDLLVITATTDGVFSKATSPAFGAWITRVPAGFGFAGQQPGLARLLFRLEPAGPVVGYSHTFERAIGQAYTIDLAQGVSAEMHPQPAVEVYPFYVEPESTVYVQGEILGEPRIVDLASIELTAQSGTLRTRTLDLGLTPTVNTLVTLDYLAPYPAAIAITARGSDNGSDWTDLGAVTDGGSLPPYRYYDFDAVFTSGGARPKLREIAIQGGDSQFLHYSTHRDVPVVGAKPYVIADSVGTLGTRIDLMKTATTSELSLSLFWTEATGDLIATGYPKNKVVRVRHGYVGLAESDYEPLLEGRFFDFDADPVKMRLALKLRDVRQMYAKRKLPEESRDVASGQKTTRPLDYPDWHAIDVILDLYDRIGIPDRYVGNFTAVREGARAGADWHVSRTVASPEEAEDLLNELAVSCGIILSPQPDGTVAPIVLDPDAAPVAIFDAREVTLSKFDGGQKELFFRSMVYYNPSTAAPGAEENDYQSLYIIENEQARLDWGEASEKRWFDKWSMSAAARAALAARMNQWYSVPRMRLTLSDVAPRHMGVRLGELVQIDNLRVPVPASQWPGIVAGRKFLVVSRDFDPRNGTLKLGLSETGTVGTPGAGVSGTDLAISGPATPFGAANLYTVTGGAAPYNWETTLGTLSSPTGSSVTLDVSGLSGEGAISVSDATGKVVARFSVLPPQVVGLTYRHTDTGTRLSWTPGDSAWVREYEIRKGTDWDSATFVAQLRSTEFDLGFLAAGTHNYLVRAYDAWDNASGLAAQVAVSVQPPSMLSLTPVVIDNNVNLYFVGLAAAYPIASYRCYRGAEWATAVFVAEGDATFQAIFERAAGSYTYWIEPRDAAGNYGAPLSVTAAVNEPPDYVLYADQDISFSAATLSALLLEQGRLLGPANLTETWQQHFDTHTWDGPQDQIDAGYPRYLQPTPSAAYVETVIDFGAVIPSTLITVSPTWQTLAGEVTLTPKIETATADTGPWTDLGEVWAAKGDGFRYVRLRVTLAGTDDHALAEISRINIRLDVKEKDDAGSGTANAADSTGTAVTFNKSFVDIVSLDVTPAYQSGIDGIIAQYDFVDEPNPTGFSVYLFKRSDGSRLSGAFSWKARGV